MQEAALGAAAWGTSRVGSLRYGGSGQSPAPIIKITYLEVIGDVWFHSGAARGIIKIVGSENKRNFLAAYPGSVVFIQPVLQRGRQES